MQFLDDSLLPENHYQTGTLWNSTDETLQKLGMAPNRAPAVRSVPLRAA
jgi:hypothetical protein